MYIKLILWVILSIQSWFRFPNCNKEQIDIIFRERHKKIFINRGKELKRVFKNNIRDSSFGQNRVT